MFTISRHLAGTKITAMKRRNFLGALGTSALGLSILSCETTVKTDQSKDRLFRIAHLTDMHIFESEKVARGMKQLLKEIHEMEDKPDFVLNTGDNIMDALKHSKEDVEQQWNAWTRYYKNELKYPLYSCIGNHDVWGWGLKDQSIQNDPLFGKAWAMKMLELEERFYAFEHKGWKFICLDSPAPVETASYTAQLDDTQFQWLEKELEHTKASTPICIVSHIPILSASVFYDGDNVKDGQWQVPGAWMHTDSKKLKELFYKYSNVKAALSGHVHLADKTEYLGVHYHCNGAACGGWWDGSYQEFGPAYAIIDFYADGSINTNLIQYKF